MKSDALIQPPRKLLSVTLVRMLIASLLAAASTAIAQTNDSHGEADSSYRTAWRLRQLAEGTASTEEARTDFHLAIAQCDAVSIKSVALWKSW